MLASPTSAQRRGEVASAEHCTAAAAVSQDACSRRHSLWLLG